MEEAVKESRVRINVSTNAKGFAQWDLTVEFPTLEESATNLSAAIDAVRNIIREKGLTEAGN